MCQIKSLLVPLEGLAVYGKAHVAQAVVNKHNLASDGGGQGRAKERRGLSNLFKFQATQATSESPVLFDMKTFSKQHETFVQTLCPGNCCRRALTSRAESSFLMGALAYE